MPIYGWRKPSKGMLYSDRRFEFAEFEISEFEISRFDCTLPLSKFVCTRT